MDILTDLNTAFEVHEGQPELVLLPGASPMAVEQVTRLVAAALPGRPVPGWGDRP